MTIIGFDDLEYMDVIDYASMKLYVVNIGNHNRTMHLQYYVVANWCKIYKILCIFIISCVYNI